MVDSTRSSCEIIECTMASFNRLLYTLTVDKQLRQKFHTYTVNAIHQELPDEAIDIQEKCSICLMDIQPATVIKAVPCKHKFHNLCLLKWMYMKPTCPVCRTFIPPS